MDIQSIDIPKLCTEWLIRKQQMPCHDVDVSHLHLSSSGWEWSKPNQIKQVTTRNVNIAFQPEHQNTFCDLSVTPESLVKSEITLSRLLVKGLNKTVDIPFGSVVPREAHMIFGNTIEVNPGEDLVENVYDLDPEPVRSKKSGDIQLAAAIKVSDNMFLGQFNFKALLTGEVLFNYGQKNMNIGQIVDDMKEFYTQDLAVVEIERYNYIFFHSAPTGISWTINGNCKLTWQPSAEINWR